MAATIVMDKIGVHHFSRRTALYRSSLHEFAVEVCVFDAIVSQANAYSIVDHLASKAAFSHRVHSNSGKVERRLFVWKKLTPLGSCYITIMTYAPRR